VAGKHQLHVADSYLKKPIFVYLAQNSQNFRKFKI